MKTTTHTYPHCKGWKKAKRLIVRNGQNHRFQGYLKEKLLAAKPLRAIFAIPKNDVETTHLEERIGSSVG